MGPSPLSRGFESKGPLEACIYVYIYMGGCQNHGSFWGPYYSTAPNI